MKCSYPIILAGRAFGCGQCLACRINQRRVWTHRIMLEAAMHEENAFVTLTYDELNMPENMSLNPEHLRNYLKRFRKHISPLKVRFYAVGEYGDQSNHPHYHLILFGFPTCRRGISVYTRHRSICCDICSIHSKTWGLGNVFLGSLSVESAAYVCGYVVKKFNKSKVEQGDGKVAEFARMSNRPGIGGEIADYISSTLMQNSLEDSIDDVPTVLRHGKQVLPLGRYIRKRVRERIGRDAKAPEIVFQQMEEEMHAVREVARATTSEFEKVSDKIRGLLIDLREGERKQLEGKQRIYRKQKVL